MKKHLILTVCLLLASMAVVLNSSAQTFSADLRRAEKLTDKGFADKKSTFDPDALDSLLKCDDYVMLISSYEGCSPCEWPRTSDVFDRYPITPYYNDFLLLGANAAIPYTFPKSGGFPTCLYFDRTGEIVAVTLGIANLYAKLDRIVREKEGICEYTVNGAPADRILPLLNYSYKANAADLKGEMEDVKNMPPKRWKYSPTSITNTCCTNIIPLKTMWFRRINITRLPWKISAKGRILSI